MNVVTDGVLKTTVPVVEVDAVRFVGRVEVVAVATVPVAL